VNDLFYEFAADFACAWAVAHREVTKPGENGMNRRAEKGNKNSPQGKGSPVGIIAALYERRRKQENHRRSSTPYRTSPEIYKETANPINPPITKFSRDSSISLHYRPGK